MLKTFFVSISNLENEDLAEDLFGATTAELKEITSGENDVDDGDGIDFETAAREYFGATIEEIIAAESHIVTSNDEPINWNAPAIDLIDSITEIEESSEVESDVEEEPKNSTTVKNVNDALESATNLKAFFETQSFSGEVMLAISQIESFLEKKIVVSSQNAKQKKVTDFFQLE